MPHQPSHVGLALILNVSDFNCFLGRFATWHPYANCDGSTAVPVLNVAESMR